jgi:hypothetical protein
VLAEDQKWRRDGNDPTNLSFQVRGTENRLQRDIAAMTVGNDVVTGIWMTGKLGQEVPSQLNARDSPILVRVPAGPAKLEELDPSEIAPH